MLTVILVVTDNAIQTLKSISLVFYNFILWVLLLQVMLYKHWSLRIVLRLYRSEEQLLKLQLPREEVLGQKQVKQIFLCVILIFIAPDPNGHVSFCHYLVFLFVHYKLVQVLADVIPLDQFEPSIETASCTLKKFIHKWYYSKTYTKHVILVPIWYPRWPAPSDKEFESFLFIAYINQVTWEPLVSSYIIPTVQAFSFF